ncbi:lipocalin-like domain-containing protein [Azoarcus olearius]|uniref:Conserved hypothetical secreted protein n=1 Tax=Azoarcus sp. (strain BH72) TaxID=418699 RepID=A1K6P2_AZOSB|nr:carotenoid 1,2-hydratase [Azoarcus olearius]CAL94497.1 conserved hypothetical secreted protein [Azoarcus olearius]
MAVRAGLFGMATCAALATVVVNGPSRAEPAPPHATAAPITPVVPGRALSFPRDHGAHPDYRTEWWYITGWLRGEDGVERGFQVTFFRVGTGLAADNPSRFAPRQLILAHAAVADPAHGRLRHAERSARALPPLAGASLEHTRAWIGNWSLAWRDGRYHAQVDDADFAFDLDFSPGGPPLLNGDQGYSRKAPQAGHASYYYSRPQMRTSGQLRLAGRTQRVEGHAWLDHEWSSTLMPPEARGWDWIGINLADGGSLMAFRMRDAEGRDLWAAATLVDAQGRTRTLPPDAVRFQPLRRWRSPRTGADYAVSWSLVLALPEGERRFRLEPLLDDQELDSRRSTGAVYWEGAVRLFDEDRDHTEAGRGYLEMTGYAERLRM